MSAKIHTVLTAVFVCAMAGCAAPTTLPSITPQAAAAYPTPAQPVSAKVVTPTAGKTTITGLIVSSDTGKPLAGIPVRLAEVYRQPNSDPLYVLSTAGSPGGTTDAAGRFAIPDLPAKEYVIFVGDPNLSYSIIREDSGKEKIWSLTANQVMDMGTFKVSLK